MKAIGGILALGAIALVAALISKKNGGSTPAVNIVKEDFERPVGIIDIPFSETELMSGTPNITVKWPTTPVLPSETLSVLSAEHEAANIELKSPAGGGAVTQDYYVDLVAARQSLIEYGMTPYQAAIEVAREMGIYHGL